MAQETEPDNGGTENGMWKAERMGNLRLATIGTSMISDNLLSAAAEVEGIEYVGTLSRNAQSASAFTASHGGSRPFSSLAELAACPDVDAVYVASPNACHFEQALACIRGGKHVLVEKPLSSNRYEAQSLYAAAELHHVVALEAMRPVHDPAWAQVFSRLGELGRLRRATFRFGKYSSRFDELRAGQHTNIFDARMASGALMDIGIYCIEPMVALFGMPSRIVAAPVLVSDARNELTGGIIDGAGSVLCSYGRHSGTPGLVVELAYSKITTDLMPSQIEGELGTLTIDAMSVPQKAQIMRRGKAIRGGATTAATSEGDVTSELAIAPCENNMIYELRDFVSLVAQESLDTLWGAGVCADGAESSFCDVTLASLAVADEIRHQAGICFPADFRTE